MSTPKLNEKLMSIETCQGISLINPMEIVWCEIAGRRITIYLNSNECIKSTHSLKDLEEKFKGYPLVRCHAKYMVNISYRLNYNTKTREIELVNKQIIIVAKDRQAEFNKRINGNSNDT